MAGWAGATVTGSGAVVTTPFCRITCWRVLGGTPKGTRTSTRPSLTLSTGAAEPAIRTEVPARVVCSGRPEAVAVESARLDPRMDIRLPGAIGDCGIRRSELITAPEV